MSSVGAIRYAVRDGWRLIVRHWGMSFLTIFTAMAVFYLIGISTLFVMNVRNIVIKLEDQLTIQAYVKPGAANLQDVDKKIKEVENVRSTQIITKEMALERLRDRLGSQADAVALLGENPLPASIEVRVENAALVTAVAEQLKKIDGIDDIVYAGTVAEKLTKVSNFIEVFSVVMLSLALLISGVVLFNTIRISVYSREEEINVMVMVGATPTYIALPFVIQGFLLGLFGSALSAILVASAYFVAVARLKEMLPFFAFVETPMLTLKLSFMLICCGATVSLIASLFAVEKFIKRAAEPI